MLLNTSALLSAVLCLPLQTLVTAAGAKCEKDSCLKIVRQGHKKGGRGGCGSIFRETVIPAASTTTLYTTEISTGPMQKRTDPAVVDSGGPIKTSATIVPKYLAAECTNFAQYSSACSCIGAKRTTFTASTPTATSTSTITLNCPLTAPTQVVQNSDFEDMTPDVANAVDWSLSGSMTYHLSGWDAFDGFYSLSAFATNGSAFQSLAMPPISAPVTYSYAANVAQFSAEAYNTYWITATLDGQTILDEQAVCPDNPDNTCDMVTVGSFMYRSLSSSGSIPSLGANPLLVVSYSVNGGSATKPALLDDVQLTLSC